MEGRKGVDENRTSRGSKATSTPQNSITSSSPSISTISRNGNDEIPMEVSENGLSSPLESEFQFFDNTLSSTSAETQVTKHVINIKTWPKPWASMKPKNKDSLYFQIVHQPHEIENIVHTLLDSYENHPKKAMMAILQFFVDICGTKKVEINNCYNYQKGNPAEIIKMMESNLSKSNFGKTGKFLFMKSSAFENKLESLIGNFFKELINVAAEKAILFNDVFAGHLLEFINCMSFSDVTAIRVTGVIMALKFLTPVVNLYDKYQRSSNRNSAHVENYIEFLYIIFMRNCFIPDVKCYMIKVVSVQELYNWITILPNFFIMKRRCLSCLVRLVSDSKDIVRLKTVSTWEKLITSDVDNVQNVMKNRIELCLKTVIARLVDVNYKVAIKAISVFTEAVDRYCRYISKEYKLHITTLIFGKHPELAKAAGKFLITYIKKQNQEIDQFLIALSKITFCREEFAERVTFFVEACIEFSPELKNWDAFITDILLKNEVPLESKKQVLELMKESMRLVLTGKCLRTPETRPQDDQEHAAVEMFLIPNFENLVTVFQNDKKCLNSLLEVLTFISYEHCHAQNFNNDYDQILSYLEGVLKITRDKSLIENICNVLYCFIDKRACPNANVILTNIKTTYGSALNDDLKQVSPDADRTVFKRLRENSLKCSVLFKKFDLTDVLKWEDIFGVSDIPLEVYLIVCCKWHLLWNLRRLITQNNNGSDFTLYKNCEEFVYECLQILENAGNQTGFFLIFESLCDFYNIFGKELKRKRQYDKFIIKINAPAQDILFKYLTHHVILNPKLPLIQRQKYLSLVVDIIFLEAVPIECLSKIFCFYHTHFDEFGVIMDHILKQLDLAVPALSLIIMDTLTKMYEQILDTRQIVIINTEEAQNLKLLAKRFAGAKILKSSNDALKLVNMSLYYSFRNRNNYAFLYFAKYFAASLKEDAKNEAYGLFRELVPNEDQENEFVLLMASALKSSVRA